MSKVNYNIREGLTEEQIKQMYERALEIIEEIGLEVSHKGILQTLSQKEGVKIEKSRVKFESWLVDKYVMSQSYPMNEFSNGYKIVSGAYEQNVIDLDTGKIRQATLKDLVELTKLADSYGMVGSAPVRPMDLPNPLQEIAMYKVSWENSSKKAQGIFDANPKSSLEVAKYIYEMSKVVNKSFSIGIWINSPFRTFPEELDILYNFLDRKVPLWVATIPIAGVTAPIHMIGAYVQSMAELFAGYTMLKLLSPESYVYCSVIDSIRAYSFDMKYGSFVYGSPEDVRATLFQIQLNRYFKIPVIAKCLLTNSQLPDPQAAAEKAAHTIIAALAGVDGFTNAGLLSVDDIYSAEQVVIDYEIVEYARRFLKSSHFNEETLSTDIIKEVVEEGRGDFLSHQSTVDNFRDAFWIPELFEHYTLRQWQAKGAKPILDRVKEIAKRRISEHHFELERNVQNELNKIYKKASESLIR